MKLNAELWQGKASLMSQSGMNQLNNFIFVLAMMQIFYSVLTMALGRAKVHSLSLLFISFFSLVNFRIYSY